MDTRVEEVSHGRQVEQTRKFEEEDAAWLQTAQRYIWSEMGHHPRPARAAGRRANC